jgi:hypothetical protein
MLTPLIRLDPITNKHDHRLAIKKVLGHPMLGELGKLFNEIIDNGEVDLQINELWDLLEEEMEYNPNELTTTADLEVDLYAIVYELVSFCNDPMNFSPDWAPPHIKADEVLLKVGQVLGRN